MLDVSLSSRRNRLCSGYTRRDFLRVGALAPLGLSLASMLGLERAIAGSAKDARAKSVILVFLGGGISHHDSFDPKPEAVEEIRGKYKTIPTAVPGLHVTELLPNMAKVMDKVALIRSGTHENDHHETASNWVLSGRSGSAFGDHPAIGAVVVATAAALAMTWRTRAGTYPAPIAWGLIGVFVAERSEGDTTLAFAGLAAAFLVAIGATLILARGRSVSRAAS